MSDGNGSNALVPQVDVRESSTPDNHNAIVPRKATAEVIEYESDNANAPSLAMAVAQLQHAIAGMGSADDVSLDYEQDRVRTKLRFRVYRHNR